jgi:hypothetical protein
MGYSLSWLLIVIGIQLSCFCPLDYDVELRRTSHTYYRTSAQTTHFTEPASTTIFVSIIHYILNYNEEKIYMNILKTDNVKMIKSLSMKLVVSWKFVQSFSSWFMRTDRRIYLIIMCSAGLHSDTGSRVYDGLKFVAQFTKMWRLKSFASPKTVTGNLLILMTSWMDYEI